MSFGIGLGIGMGKVVRGSNVLPGFASATYADYPTGLAATADGKYFSVNLSDGLSRYVWRRVSGAGELAAIYPVNYTTALAAQKAAGNTGAGGEQLPASPIIDAVAVDNLWYDGKIPNRVVGKPDFNIFGASRATDMPFLNTFAPTTLGWTLNGGTWVLTPFVAGPDGALKAVEFANSSTTGSALISFPAVTVPPGRWTLAFDIKSNTSPVSLQYGANFVTGLSVANVTTSWQTFTQTFTLAGAASRQIAFGFFPTAVVCDISIDNIRLTPGWVAGTATQTGANLWRAGGAGTRSGYFPDSTAKTQTYASNLGSLASYSAFSVVIAVKHTGALPSASFEGAFLQGFTNSYGTGTPFVGGSHNLYVGPDINYHAGEGVSTPMTAMENRWVILAVSAGPSGQKMWVDGIPISVSATAFAGFTSTLFQIMGNGGFSFAGVFGASTAWNRQLSDQEISDACAVTRARLAAMGAGYTAAASVYFPDGDSITAGAAGTPGYAYRIGANFTPYLQGLNFAVSGSVLANLVTRAPQTLAAVQNAVAAGKRVIYSVLLGANDAPASTAAADTFIANLLSYLASFRSAGAKVIACTPLARNMSTTYDTSVREYVCTQLRASSSGYDGLCDFAADPNLDVWSSTYWGADALHPNNAGHIEMAGIMLPVVSSLWV